jgi:hypothetical protein
VKGDGIGCFVILKNGVEGSDELAVKLKNAVRNSIGPFAQVCGAYAFHRFAFVLHSPRIRFEIIPQSLLLWDRFRVKTALRLLYNRSAYAPLSLCNRFRIALQSL